MIFFKNIEHAVFHAITFLEMKCQLFVFFQTHDISLIFKIIMLIHFEACFSTLKGPSSGYQVDGLPLDAS